MILNKFSFYDFFGFTIFLISTILIFADIHKQIVNKANQKVSLPKSTLMLTSFFMINYHPMKVFLGLFYILTLFIRLYKSEYSARIAYGKGLKLKTLLLEISILQFILLYFSNNLIIFFIGLLHSMYLLKYRKNQYLPNEEIRFSLDQKLFSEKINKIKYDKLNLEDIKSLFKIYYTDYEKGLDLITQYPIDEELIIQFIRYHLIHNKKLIMNENYIKEIRDKILNDNEQVKKMLYYSGDTSSLIISEDDFVRNNIKDVEFRKKYILEILNITCNKCLICNDTGNGIELDHFVIPKSKGGNFILNHKHNFKIINAIPLCISCNRKKQDKHPLEIIDENKFKEILNHIKNIEQVVENV